MQIFNPITELVFPIGTSIREEKAEIEMHAVIVEGNTRKCYLELYKPLCAFYSSIYFALFLQKSFFFVLSIFFNLNS